MNFDTCIQGDIGVQK